MKLGDDLAYTCDAIDSVKKLENENDELLRLLQILKVSAISALVEKEQQMTQMKEREDMNNQERIEYYEQQLEDAKRKIQDALEVIHEIQSEADYVKANLIAEIKEK